MQPVAERDSRSIPAMMSLVWPGLGQILQGRYPRGLYFVAESLIVLLLFLASPSMRVPLGIALALITLWSVVDAYRAQ